MSVSLPIPEPRAEDDEDVHWALSTASALWARGEPQEALKWLRRAAETASDANLDARSLELFKAAADFANGIQGAPKPSAPPPAPPQLQPMLAAPPAGWPTPGVVQMTVGNQAPHAQPRPQSSAPPPPNRSRPPAMPAHANGGSQRGPEPQHAPLTVQGRGPVQLPPQRQGSIPNHGGPPQRGPTRGEPQTWQPRAGQQPPPGPFQAGAGGGVAMPLSDAMAPTMPHPSAHPTAAISQIPWQPPSDPSTARIPITDVDAAIKKMEAQRIGTGSVKTLASNTSFDDLTDESVRKSAKSTKAARDPRLLASDRATNPGVGGPEGVENGTVLSSHALITSVVAPPQTQPSTTAEASRTANQPAPQPSPAKPSKRRATQTGRRGTKTDPTEQVTRVAPAQPALSTVPGVPSGDVAILEANGQDEARTMRFDDEGTLEQHATLVGVLAYDLDEQTNVLSGTEANLVLKPEHQNGVEKGDAEKESATDADEGGPTSETPTDDPPEEARRERTVTERPLGGDVGFRSLSAYRVALYRTPSGAVEVKLLAPGEPTPAGRVGAILVPVDAVSSTALYELLAAKPR